MIMGELLSPNIDEVELFAMEAIELSYHAKIRTAMVFRTQAPQESPNGNVRALAIRDLVSAKPLQWDELPRISIDESLLGQCLQPGDVVIPSRGDYYRSWVYEGANAPVFPLGQLNIITPNATLDARYLAWYLNKKSTQAMLGSMLTGTSIKALTKVALLSLRVELPDFAKQLLIADLDRTTQRIGAIRHRLNELDKEEMAYLTSTLLLAEDSSHG
jgi:hypothetical protein